MERRYIVLLLMCYVELNENYILSFNEVIFSVNVFRNKDPPFQDLFDSDDNCNGGVLVCFTQRFRPSISSVLVFFCC